MHFRQIAPLVVGLALLGCVALFPPMIGSAGSGIAGAGRAAWPARGFLFSPESFQTSVQWKGDALSVPAEIDTGRLLAESLIIVAISGLTFLIVSASADRGASRH